MAYFSIEPFGAFRDNLHTGIIASTVANCHSKKKFSANDFIIKDEHEEKQDKLAGFMNNLRTMSTPSEKQNGTKKPRKNNR